MAPDRLREPGLGRIEVDTPASNVGALRQDGDSRRRPRQEVVDHDPIASHPPRSASRRGLSRRLLLPVGPLEDCRAKRKLADGTRIEFDDGSAEPFPSLNCCSSSRLQLRAGQGLERRDPLPNGSSAKMLAVGDAPVGARNQRLLRAPPVLMKESCAPPWSGRRVAANWASAIRSASGDCGRPRLLASGPARWPTSALRLGLHVASA